MRVGENNTARAQSTQHIPNSARNARNPPKAMAARAAEQQTMGKMVGTGADAYSTGDSFRGFLPAGADGLDAVYQELWDGEQAGLARPAFQNADAHVMSYNYKTNRGDDLYLMDLPPDGQLKLNIVASPSAHDGDAKYHEYAKTNVYFVHAQYTSKSTGKTVYLQKDGQFRPERPPSTVRNGTPGAEKMMSFEVEDKKDGEYASVSPDVTIDLNDVAGDLWVGGFAKFSAGVGGYVDGRKNMIHLPPDYE